MIVYRRDASSNRRLPAEWEAQDGVLLIWPHEASDWGNVLDDVEPAFAIIAASISLYEKILIIGDSERYLPLCLQAGAVEQNIISCDFYQTNDTWARDCGPITIRERDNLILGDWVFNGWGNKFPAEADNQLTKFLMTGKIFRSHCESYSEVLEGGSIESDGLRTLLSTRACLFHKNRNPDKRPEELCDVILERTGANRMVLLENGALLGDDTDAHIDTLARFASDSTIIYTACDDCLDEHYDDLAAMEKELQELRTTEGDPYQLLPLPWPKPCYAEDGQRLPATYANFLIINNAVLMPQYGDTVKDSEALSVVGKAFSDRVIIPIPSRAFIEQHGSIHCLTMQLPQGVLV